MMKRGLTPLLHGVQARLASLDVFRGLTIAGMILVNNPGSGRHVYALLKHADWHGCTPADLVFPFFVFIVGVAIVVSREKPVPVILRRGALLWALGLGLAAYPKLAGGLARLRLLGVLPRLGICYAATALAARVLSVRGVVALVVALLLGYWAAMAGYGHLDSSRDNLEAVIDRAVLGDHIWSGSKVYDPEGILSTLPAIATCLIGWLAGKLLVGAAPGRQALRLALLGSPLALLGYAWGFAFPINKAIWTSSYVLFTAGLAACALAVCVLLCDARRPGAWAWPFQTLGLNAITAFVGSGLLVKTLAWLEWRKPVYEAAFASWLPPHAASLAWALGHVVLWIAVLAVMRRLGIVLRV
jgi:predicted acyltransferase